MAENVFENSIFCLHVLSCFRCKYYFQLSEVCKLDAHFLSVLTEVLNMTTECGVYQLLTRKTPEKVKVMFYSTEQTIRVVLVGQADEPELKVSDSSDAESDHL